MEEKKNIALSNPQPIVNFTPSADPRPSADLKKALLGLDLLLEDFEKSAGFLHQIEHFLSAPLAFDLAQKQVKQLVESLASVTERVLENHQYLSSHLEAIHEKTVELENAIGESHESINARFAFWYHPFENAHPGGEKGSRETSSFSDFLDLIIDTCAAYSYFMASFEALPLLVCRYIPVDATPKDQPEQIQRSAYVAPPTGAFQTFKRLWSKLFRSPTKSILHLFHHSRPKSLLGTFKHRLTVPMQPYKPHRHTQPDQLPKIIYDFINMYGVSGRRNVHLLRRDDKFSVFVTQYPIQFNGRLAQLSNIDCKHEASKATHQLLLE